MLTNSQGHGSYLKITKKCKSLGFLIHLKEIGYQWSFHNASFYSCFMFKNSSLSFPHKSSEEAHDKINDPVATAIRELIDLIFAYT